jgi:hypothetical protein
MKNNDVIDTISKGKYFVQIMQDSDLNETPRDWDNLGTMVCWHNNYYLGDMANKNRLHGKGENTFSTPEEFEEWYKENENNVAIILPLYLYDHSGLSISTGSFHDMWDSGQVGFIFVTKEEVKKEYNKKLCTKQIKELAEKVLESEVTVYDQYLRGDVYGYALYKLNLDDDMELEDSDDPADFGEEIDSCWGYYGLRDLKEELTNTIKGYIKEDEELAWKNVILEVA